MSGGHIGYHQHRLTSIAFEIEELIVMNNCEDLDRFGEKLGNGYSQEIIEKFEEAVHTLRQAAEMIERINYLVSGDDGPDTFLREWAESFPSPGGNPTAFETNHPGENQIIDLSANDNVDASPPKTPQDNAKK